MQSCRFESFARIHKNLMKGVSLTTTTTTMATFLGSVGEVATDIFEWVGTAAETIVSTPLLLFTVGFLAVGGAVGILGRLLSRG